MLAAIALRPCTCWPPSTTATKTPPTIHAALLAARKVYALYDAAAKFKSEEPWDYNHFAGDMEDRIVMCWARMGGSQWSVVSGGLGSGWLLVLPPPTCLNHSRASPRHRPSGSRHNSKCPSPS